jgi:competence protein ComEA
VANVLTLPLGVQGRRLLAVALAGVLLLVLAWRHTAGAASPPLRVAPIAPRARAGPAVAARPLVVDVVGAVRRPGLVHLARGARAADAIASAGWLTPHALRAGVNLAALVADGEQLVVPERGAPGEGAAAGGGGGTSGAPVSLSTATAEQLDALPGIGPVTAQKIVAYREQHGPFGSVDGLDAIPGIGPARIADLQGLVVP